MDDQVNRMIFLLAFSLPSLFLSICISISVSFSLQSSAPQRLNHADFYLNYTDSPKDAVICLLPFLTATVLVSEILKFALHNFL